MFILSKPILHIDVWGVKFTTSLTADNKIADATIAVDLVNDRSSNEDVTIAASLLTIKAILHLRQKRI